MHHISNPFIITGRYVSEEYFCDREQETAELAGNIENWRNTVLVSPRRMGKSGLIGHLFSLESVSSVYETFFIDIYDTETMDDFIHLLGKEIAERLQPKGSKLLSSFLSIVNSLKITFSADQFSGVPTVDLSLGDMYSPQSTLEQIFEFLEASSRPCIVAIDEFQRIADYPDSRKMVALLRKCVQRCKQTRFIFAGSNRRMMGRLFNSPDEPFFMSCTPLSLSSIDKDKYIDFVKRHFEQSGKHIDQKCISDVYDRFEGHTWYIQYVFNVLYEMTEKEAVAVEADVEASISHILDIFNQTFQEQLLGYSVRQRALLKAISKEGKAENIMGAAFIKKYRLDTSSAVQGALTPLLEKETLTVENGIYHVTNRFFSLWLRRRY